ncbi:FG-GAP repeat domain-containing protein [Sphaerisporangium perillae]|uniref:FG-GAP repeat domain-containing protein n=1 Tax=Sphaerisporangium perillae TaxID=2935860 RepID=UPI00200D5FC5|nr:VCBS repeat-containing protein [Sphaerisporangium perillae]
MTRRPFLMVPLLAGLLAVALPAVAAPRAEAAADCANAGANDFDGDGRDDVVVGDPLADAGGVPGAGAVHILPFGGNGTGKGLVVTASDAKAGDAFGWTVRTTHFDGDRCLDVVVGAPYADAEGAADAGAVYVIRGGAYDGRVPAEAISELAQPKPERDGHFGWSLAAARAPDRPAGVIAVGAPYENADRTDDAGAVYLYCAKPGGGTEPVIRITQQSEGIVGNSELGDMFGWSLVFGRFGGRADSMDLVVGTPYENDDGVGKQAGNAGKPDTGAVEIVFDAAEAGDTYTSVKWGIPESVKGVIEHAGDRYGYALAYAESGGVPYLAASAPLADVGGVADSGLVQVFKPGKDGKPAPARTIRLGGEGLDDQPAKAGAALGWSLAMVGSSKALRLAIGDPFDSRDGTQAGVIRQVRLSGAPGGTGKADGTGGGGGAGNALLRTGQAHPYDHFGWSVAAFGASDSFAPGAGLLVGAPDQQGTPGGAVAVLREGAPTRLLVPGRDGVPVVPDGGSADFGAAITG